MDDATAARHRRLALQRGKRRRLQRGESSSGGASVLPASEESQHSFNYAVNFEQGNPEILKRGLLASVFLLWGVLHVP